MKSRASLPSQHRDARQIRGLANHFIARKCEPRWRPFTLEKSCPSHNVSQRGAPATSQADLRWRSRPISGEPRGTVGPRGRRRTIREHPSENRALQAKQHGPTLALLSGEKRSVTPRGTMYPRLWFLILLLIAIGLTIMPGAANLFDHLQPSPYQNLFTLSYYLRWGLQFALSLGCVIWFSRALNELKRECLIVERVRAQRLGS